MNDAPPRYEIPDDDDSYECEYYEEDDPQLYFQFNETRDEKESALIDKISDLISFCKEHNICMNARTAHDPVSISYSPTPFLRLVGFDIAIRF